MSKIALRKGDSMINEVGERWISAMRNGEYGEYPIRQDMRTDEGMDAMGVLCSVSGLGAWHRERGIWMYRLESWEYGGDTEWCPPEVLEIAGIDELEHIQVVIAMCDAGYSFAAIADWVETRQADVFGVNQRLEAEAEAYCPFHAPSAGDTV